MSARGRIFAALLAGAVVASAGGGRAQAQAIRPRPPRRPWRPPPTAVPAAADADTTDFRGRFGLDVAMRLMKRPDAEDKLRGLERAAATRSPEALAILERAAGSAPSSSPLDGIVKGDPRALLVVVRGLASWTDHEPARTALEALLKETRDPAAVDADDAGRVVLAREEAAMALARTEDPACLQKLLDLGRSNGVAQAAALDALAAHPPANALLGGVTLTTPATIALAVSVGDLRSLGAILGAVHASDAALRAAAIAALGEAGDARVLDVAREAGKDKDPRVRVAGAEALVRLGAPDAGPAVEALIGDEATAREGLRLAQQVQGEGVTKAAAARAAATADAEVRSLAVLALGRQTSPAAVAALTALAADPRVGGDALEALARSPSGAAMGAIEAMAAVPGTRRAAGRVYFVRRAVRSERSAAGDALLAALAASEDGADRAVGTEALVALGERPLENALEDRDPRVRRAAAMGAGARGDERSTQGKLLARLAVERDGATREVLAAALAGGDPGALVPTETLLDRAQAGGADAPLAGLALARRADELLEPKVDALLGSHDPVMRAHVALGLAESAAPDAAGRLAAAYAWEPSGAVRRVLVRALAARSGVDAEAPSRQEALALAAALEPDAVTRDIARRAMGGLRAPPRPAGGEVAWLHVVPAEGAALPHALAAVLVGDDAVARPVVFDDDGYALVPGLPPGDARVRFEARVPADASR